MRRWHQVSKKWLDRKLPRDSELWGKTSSLLPRSKGKMSSTFAFPFRLINLNFELETVTLRKRFVNQFNQDGKMKVFQALTHRRGENL